MLLYRTFRGIELLSDDGNLLAACPSCRTLVRF